jgi:8-oxo-dGTP pyrophosphatase MutT (NUDIX family)
MIDFLFRCTYRCAYPVMKMLWLIFDPPRHGTLVAVWYDRKILVIKNSYVAYYCFPGGYAKGGEEPAAAAVRELKEELNIDVSPDDLTVLYDNRPVEGNHAQSIFSIELSDPPDCRVDNREVISCELLTPAQALDLKLYPQVRDIISQANT